MTPPRPGLWSRILAVETWQIVLLALYITVWAVGMVLQAVLLRRLKAKTSEDLDLHLGPGASARLASTSPAGSLILLRLLFTNNPLSRSPDLHTLCLWLRGTVIFIVLSLAGIAVAFAGPHSPRDRQDTAAPSPTAETMDLPGFEKALAILQRESATDPNSPAVRELLRTLDANFNPSLWLNEVPSPDMASPSPERLERIEQIARTIAPYESVLVSLGFNKALGSDAIRAVNLLWYAAPSPALKERLLGETANDSFAYVVLFETGMFDPQVRSRFVQGLSAPASPELRHQRASMACSWGLVEAIPVYIELLQKPFDPTTISFVGHVPAEDAEGSLSGYRLASEAAMYLGPAGTTLLPLLKQRYSEIQAAFPDKGQVLTGSLKAAIDVLEGRRNPPVHAAINGRGEINLTKGYSPIDRTANTTPATFTPAPSANEPAPAPPKPQGP